jgi:hypothetical protein
MKVYHVEPFEPVISEKVATKKGADTIAEQLAAMLNRGAAGGWTFERYENVVTTVNPGCLTIFAGAKTVTYGVLVFSKEQ